MTRRGDFHPQGRDAYLGSVKSPNSPWGHLGQKVDRVNAPLRATGSHEKDSVDTSTSGDSALSTGLPWITQILGSGILGVGTPAADRTLSEWLATFLANDKSDESLYLASPAMSELTKGFAESLLMAHTGELTDPRALGKKPFVPPPYLGSLFGVTASLTHLYHRVREVSYQALTPLGGHSFSLSDDEAGQGSESAMSRLLLALHDEVEANRIELTERIDVGDQLAWDIAAVQGLRETEMLGRLLAGMTANKPVFQLEDLYLLTEFCWHFVRREGAIYPDWSELLLQVAIARADLDLHWRPRPTNVGHEGVAAIVEKLLEDSTKRSWEQRLRVPEARENPWSAVHDYYNTSAQVLVEQARIANAFGAAEVVPQAVALVTSMDLELEMALWEVGQPFVVVQPVLFVEGYDEEDPKSFRIHHAWIAAKIRPDRDLKIDAQLCRLRDASRHEWFLMDSQATVRTDLHEHPIVVRLTGSPLQELPDLVAVDGWSKLARDLMGEIQASQRLRQLGIGTPNRRPLRLLHTIQLDEYTAVSTQAADLMMGSDDPLRWVTEAGPSHSRFWMLAGIQFSDSGVRSRLATQAVSSALSEAQGGQGSKNPNRPSRRGMLVNRRSNAQTRDLLQWAGFDVVGGDCRAFRKDLQHYLKHLKAFTGENVEVIHCRASQKCGL